jgi:hydroxyacylglutathione hydrolase
MLETNGTPQNSKLDGENMTNKAVIFETKEDNLHFEGVFDIDPRELAKKLKEVYIIDVRQPDEFTGELGHIPGAHLMVLDTVPARIFEIPKNQTVVFVCRSGGRSARATAFALEGGLKDVYNLKGGMLLWNDLHLPTEI